MKKRALLFVVLLLGMFMMPNIVSAKEIVEITNLELVEKSDSTTIKEDGTFKDLEVGLNIKFKYVGDFAKYKITLHNNDSKKYELKLEDLETDYIKYSYEYDETLEANKDTNIVLTVKYDSEVPDEKLTNNLLQQKGTIKFNIKGEEINNANENKPDKVIPESSPKTEETENPKTYDGIRTSIILAIISTIAIVLLIVYRKKINKKVILPLIAVCMVLPITAYALEELSLNITVNIEIEKEETYKISYSDSIKSYSVESNPVKVVKGKDVAVKFNGLKNGNIVLVINGTKLNTGNTYENSNGEISTFTVKDGVATVTNVYEDLLFKKRDDVIVNLGASSAIQNYASKADVKTIEFTNHVDISKADKYWDITEDQSGLAYAWVEGEAWIEGSTMYIGSELNMSPSTLENAFYGMSSVEEINFNGNLDTSNVTSMKGAFRQCKSLKSLDLSSFDTSNVTDMYGMFWTTTVLEELNLSSFNTSNVTNMAYMFDGMRKMKKLDLSNFNTEKVTDMKYMFAYMNDLNEVNLSSFNTSKVTNMNYMFQDCLSLTVLNLSNFNTSNVTSMSGMFMRLTSVKELDLNNFNTSNVTNMTYMFGECKNLEKVKMDNFNTEKVTDMSHMFRECLSLLVLDLSSFNTKSTTNIYRMFSGDSNLTTIYASDSFVTTKVTTYTDVFKDCNSLVGGNGTGWNSSYASSKTYARIDKEGTPGYFTAK